MSSNNLRVGLIFTSSEGDGIVLSPGKAMILTVQGDSGGQCMRCCQVPADATRGTPSDLKVEIALNSVRFILERGSWSPN